MAAFYENSPDKWRQLDVMCFDGDPECEHPGIRCPKCNKSFDLIIENQDQNHETTLIYADGTRKEPRC